MNATRAEQLRKITKEEANFVVQSKHNVFNRKGVKVDCNTTQHYCVTDEQCSEWLIHLNWLNENRTEAGKYFDIRVQAL